MHVGGPRTVKARGVQSGAMQAKREYRDRGETQVEVLDALVERGEEGMTVFEVRAHVDADIDRIETALAELKEDGLIEAERNGERTLLYPDDRVVPEPGETDQERGIVDRIREKLPL